MNESLITKPTIVSSPISWEFFYYHHIICVTICNLILAVVKVGEG